MEQFTQFMTQLPNYAGIFVLMLTAFLIGYFSSWSMQRAKYSKILRNITRKSNLSRPHRKANDIDIIFTEIKPKIIEVVKETQEELELQKGIVETIVTKSKQEIVKNARTSYITYNHNKAELNFDSFGYAYDSDREDLTKISGIGPYIEQKLNEIGVYNFEQISRFKDEDIKVLTELIDFFPGRIERDDWVGQAENLNN